MCASGSFTNADRNPPGFTVFDLTGAICHALCHTVKVSDAETQAYGYSGSDIPTDTYKGGANCEIHHRL